LNTKLIRAFIAIELPEELQSGILRLQNEFKSAGHTRVKWVTPQNIHLTLKFLGNISSEKAEEIKEVLEKAKQGIAPFQLKTDKLGAFPNIRQPRVFWLGMTGELETLLTLQQCIDKALINLGFSKEERLFSPHITIARTRDSATREEKAEFGKSIEKTPFTDRYTIYVASFNLMRSQLLPSGAIYSRLAIVNLNR
jgi:2'-5' RNA ligase